MILDNLPVAVGPRAAFSASICFSILGFQIRFHWSLWKLFHYLLKRKRNKQTKAKTLRTTSLVQLLF